MDSTLGRGCKLEERLSVLRNLASLSSGGGDWSLLAPKIPEPLVGGLRPRNSSSSRRGGSGTGGSNGCDPLTVGYTETGRNPGVSTSVFRPEPGLVGDSGVVASADTERKYPGLPWLKELAIVRGGNLLMRFPPLALSSNCFASSRLCAANASRGESSGGMSPAT
jgi:hypothetical protein